MSRRRSSGARAVALALIQSLFWPVAPVLATEFPLTAQDTAVGRISSHEVRPSTTLMDVARSLDLGFTQLMAVNLGINPWLPRPGTRIAVPDFYLLPDVPRQGIVIDLAAQRLYYFPPGKSVVQTYPIGMGALGAVTPVGVTRVTRKDTNPTWTPPPSIRAEMPGLPASIPPGPDNPLGAYALRLGWPSYLIHGTNKPDGVGRNVSHGCIRLYPEDIEQLFRDASVGTPVRVVDDEVRLAWVGSELYMAIYPTKAQSDEIDVQGTLTPVPPPPDLQTRIARAAGDQMGRIDWPMVQRIASARTGVPTRIAVSAQASFGSMIAPVADETVSPTGSHGRF